MPRLVHKRVGADPEVIDVDAVDLKTLQGLVGGYIENVFVRGANKAPNRELALVVNEEGHVRGLLHNVRHPGDMRYPIAGDVVAVVYDNGGEVHGLTEDEVELATLVLRELAL